MAFNKETLIGPMGNVLIKRSKLKFLNGPNCYATGFGVDENWSDDAARC